MRTRILLIGGVVVLIALAVVLFRNNFEKVPVTRIDGRAL